MEGLGFVASKRSESKKNGSPRNGGLQSAENPVNMKEGQNMFEKNLKLRNLASTKSSK